jgi:hypothetical protein
MAMGIDHRFNRIFNFANLIRVLARRLILLTSLVLPFTLPENGMTTLLYLKLECLLID